MKPERTNPRLNRELIHKLEARIAALEARVEALEPSTDDGFHVRRGPRGHWYVYQGETRTGSGFAEREDAEARAEELNEDIQPMMVDA